MNNNPFPEFNGFVNNSRQSEFVTSNYIITRYRITAMTLWRWIKSDNVNFPKPIYINKRRYFRIDDVMKWEAERESGSAN